MIWLIGSGTMATEYAKVLLALRVQFKVIGRGEVSAGNFEKCCGVTVERGGLSTFLETKPPLPEAVIVAVSVDQLSIASGQLISYGVTKILLEKPGGTSPHEIIELADFASKNSALVLLGYNRRFYGSVLKAQEIISQDGGIQSFTFEFTEWSHVIRESSNARQVLENWFLANSTHVVDLAFYLGGKPSAIHSFTAGSLDWHSRASRFCGCGISSKNTLFSYHADWAAPGRWSLEFLTSSSRLIFRPMEKLHIQKIGSIAIEELSLDDSLDIDFKPGLYRQTKAFFDGDYQQMCSITQQLDGLNVYSKMAGYK